MSFEQIHSNQNDEYLLQKRKPTLLEQCFPFCKKKEIKALDPQTMSGFSNDFSYFPDEFSIFSKPVVVKHFSLIKFEKNERIITPDESTYTGEGTGHNTKAKFEDEYERYINERNNDDSHFQKMFEKPKET
jgi:hypothetical protein